MSATRALLIGVVTLAGVSLARAHGGFHERVAAADAAVAAAPERAEPYLAGV